METQIRAAALKWAQAIETRIPENVLKVYHPDGSLWGTLAQEYLHGLKAMEGYFVNFLDKEELKCEFREDHIRIFNEFAFYSGSYEFTWLFSGKMVCLPARFSFVFRKVKGEWLIMEHHSSLFPPKPFPIRKYLKK
ncbi:MAG: SnoaL-like domain-containing protein [Bacteroidales bacterium]|nr:SnoaL-like domain-containing protein [Bacteroidales bacterium]